MLQLGHETQETGEPSRSTSTNQLNGDDKDLQGVNSKSTAVSSISVGTRSVRFALSGLEGVLMRRVQDIISGCAEARLPR